VNQTFFLKKIKIKKSEVAREVTRIEIDTQLVDCWSLVRIRGFNKYVAVLVIYIVGRRDFEFVVSLYIGSRL